MVQEVHHNDLTAALAAPVAVLDFKAAFFGIDCDENPQLAAQFGVSSIPCLVVLKDGKMVTHQVGFQPKPALVSWLNGVL